MIIEWHTHVYPPEEAAADALAWDGKSGPTWAGRCPMTLENVLDAHHRCGIGVTVFSNAAHYMRGKPEAEELKAIQRWSDYAAEIQAAHKGMLYGFATMLPCGGPPSSRRPSAPFASSGSKASSSIRTTRAIIRTTTRRGRSGSWCKTSMCRSSSIRRMSASARSG